MDVQGQIDAWLTRLASERKASPHTLDGYRRDLAKLLRFMQTQQITSFDLLIPNRMRGFIAAEHRAGLSPKSLQRLLSSCRSLFRQLTREGLLTHDPLAGVRGPKVHRKLPEVLDVDEATALVEGEGDDALNRRDRAMLELFYSSGLRLSELTGLRWLDLDLDAGEVRVLGKGRKTRIVPVGRHAIAALRALGEAEGCEADSPVFRGRNTTTEFLAGEIFRRLKERIAAGALGPGTAGALAQLRVVLRESPVAWAACAGPLVG